MLIPARYFVNAMQTLFQAGDALERPDAATCFFSSLRPPSSSCSPRATPAAAGLTRCNSSTASARWSSRNCSRCSAIRRAAGCSFMPVILQTTLFPFAATLEVKNDTLAVFNEDAGAASVELIQRFAAPGLHRNALSARRREHARDHRQPAGARRRAHSRPISRANVAAGTAGDHPGVARRPPFEQRADRLQLPAGNRPETTPTNAMRSAGRVPAVGNRRPALVQSESRLHATSSCPAWWRSSPRSARSLSPRSRSRANASRGPSTSCWSRR